MATNPMQRKARNSFLIGMLVMLLITGIVIGILIFQLKGKMDKEKEELAASVKVYVLNTDVRSGQTITSEMYKTLTVNKNQVPSNAVGDLTILDGYALQDKEGSVIFTEIDKNNQAKMYINKENQKHEVMIEEETGNYYINKDGQKKFLELDTVPLVAKVTMKANNIITTEFLSKGDSKITDDLRKQEYNMFSLPMDLVTGDYVDIRFMLPSGQDYIVVSKKEVEVPNIAGVDSPTTIWANLSEDEILSMSGAIVEAYQLLGSKLYVAKYTEAGLQKPATPTYVPNAKVTELINSNPNVVTSAMIELRARYSESNKNLRNSHINQAIDGAGEEGRENMKTKMQESIVNSQTTRKEYLEGLAGVVK